MTVDPRIVLGHGASGTAASMEPYITGLRARGLRADAINLRRGRAEDAVSGFWEASVALAADAPSDGLILGGQSFGGRVASFVAAGRPTEIAGLVCFSYPLHRPGAPETWVTRTVHWPRHPGPNNASPTPPRRYRTATADSPR